MTPAERTAKIAELRAEADRLEREGDIMAKAVNGALFRSYGRIVLIPPRTPVDYAIALDGAAPGCHCHGWSEDPNLEYLGHARDLLTIKTPDAPEPTGADLVGKVCEFSPDGKEWVAIGRCDKYCGPDDREPFCFFCGQSGPRYGWWSFARLYREGRP